jgi:carboxymethylenebutenolidase
MRGSDTDPTHATSLEFKRRTFVGLAAAATAGLGTATGVFAQPATPMGQAHVPLVPESDDSLVVDRLQLDVAGAKIAAYAAWPRNAVVQTPSVVVVMHIWGVDASIRDVVRRFAKAGFAAIAPDLYARWGAPSGDGTTDSAVFRPFAKRLDREQYVDDIRAAAAWTRAKFPATKTAILGFCMGGRIALQAAADTGDLFVAVCPFYGSFDGVDPNALRIPVCGSYGGRDTSIPPADVHAFAAALHVPNDIRVYDDAGHAFFDDQRATYVPAAAEDAWKRTLAFLQRYAGASTE